MIELVEHNYDQIVKEITNCFDFSNQWIPTINGYYIYWTGWKDKRNWEPDKPWIIGQWCLAKKIEDDSTRKCVYSSYPGSTGFYYALTGKSIFDIEPKTDQPCIHPDAIGSKYGTEFMEIAKYQTFQRLLDFCREQNLIPK